MSSARARGLTVAALLLVVAVAVAVLRGAGADPQTVTARFQDAGLLVKGNQVRVGGAVVGTVSDISLGNDGRAAVELRISDRSSLPLRRGTRAIVRNSSVSSVAGRYVALELGPLDAPRLPDHAEIATLDTRAAVDFDEFLNTVDGESRRALQELFATGSSALAGAETSFGRTLVQLNPALAQIRDVTAEIGRDEPALQRLLVDTATVSGAFAEHREDLGQGLVAAATTVRALARERGALSGTLRRAPALLAQGRTTLRATDALLRDARPVARAAQPIAPRLARTLRLAQPTARELRPLLRDLDGTLPVLDDALVRLPALAERAAPALRETTRAAEGVAPVVSGLRPFTPDLVSGVLGAFGGRAGSNYDAIGHVGRISPIVNSAALPDLIAPLAELLDPLLGAIGGNTLGGYQSGNVVRCPGGAAGTSADGTRPWAAGVSGRCSTLDDGRGR